MPPARYANAPIIQISTAYHHIGGRAERTMKPLLKWLIDRDKPQLAEQFARIFLNLYSVREVHTAYQRSLNLANNASN